MIKWYLRHHKWAKGGRNDAKESQKWVKGCQNGAKVGQSGVKGVKIGLNGVILGLGLYLLKYPIMLQHTLLTSNDL